MEKRESKTNGKVNLIRDPIIHNTLQSGDEENRVNPITPQLHFQHLIQQNISFGRERHSIASVKLVETKNGIEIKENLHVISNFQPSSKGSVLNALLYV